MSRFHRRRDRRRQQVESSVISKQNTAAGRGSLHSISIRDKRLRQEQRGRVNTSSSGTHISLSSGPLPCNKSALRESPFIKVPHTTVFGTERGRLGDHAARRRDIFCRFLPQRGGIPEREKKKSGKEGKLDSVLREKKGEEKTGAVRQSLVRHAEVYYTGRERGSGKESRREEIFPTSVPYFPKWWQPKAQRGTLSTQMVSRTANKEVARPWRVCVAVGGCIPTLPESTPAKRKGHKLVDWSKFRNTELGEVDNIDEWSAKLLAATEGATEEIDAPEEIETMDPRLAHLLEARRSLQKRWRRQRHNRKLRKKIAELCREIERHSRQLCSQQWFALCSQADGQLHRGGTWKLLRQLMNETKSCEYQPAGRGLLDRVGLLPPGERPGAGPDGELEEQVPLSDEAARKTIVYPLPKNMDPERDAGRRAVRAAALARQHQRDEGAVYVDAARYPGRRNAFAAVVVSATTGKLLTASTVRAQKAGQAEGMAIALATELALTSSYTYSLTSNLTGAAAKN
ncbi:hypothetical protein MRX96_017938 [Rhipicephalus microplus]